VNKTNETDLKKPRVLACIEVNKDFSRYTLYFTKNEMSAAKTGIPPLLVVVAVVCWGIGLLFLAAIFITAIHPRGTLEPMWQTQLLLWTALILIFGPYSYAKWRQKKQIKKYFDAPESILMATKENFEIAYDDIIRIEMHPAGRIGAAKINVVTDITEYKFPIVKKENFDYYMDLLLPILPGKVRVYR